MKKEKMNIHNILKYTIIFVFILGIIICIPFILNIINKVKIQNTLDEYFQTLKMGNYDESLKYLDKDYDYSNNELGIYSDELVDFYSKFIIDTYTIDFKNNYAIVTLKLKNPKITYLIDENFKLKISERNYHTNYYKTILDSKHLEYEESEAQLSLKKINNKWKIINNIFLKTFLDYGTNKYSISFDMLVENETNNKEINDYINNFVNIVDYEIDYDDLGQLSLHNIEIKNSGNRDITKLEVEVIFPSKNIKRTIVLFDDESSQLKSGYSWKSKNDIYYDLNRSSKNILTSTDKENVQLKIRNLKFGNSIYGPSEIEEQKYINEYLEIKSYEIKEYRDILGDVVPGIGNISLKNKGNRDISELTITVYFQDVDGKNIAEDVFLIIGGIHFTNTLKANYFWKLDDDIFYEFKNLTSEVNLNRHRVKITEIKFAD